jgi:hypothetical protein
MATSFPALTRGVYRELRGASAFKYNDLASLNTALAKLDGNTPPS